MGKKIKWCSTKLTTIDKEVTDGSLWEQLNVGDETMRAGWLQYFGPGKSQSIISNRAMTLAPDEARMASREAGDSRRGPVRIAKSIDHTLIPEHAGEVSKGSTELKSCQS